MKFHFIAISFTVFVLLAAGCASPAQEQPTAAVDTPERHQAAVQPTGEPLTIDQYDEGLFSANNRVGEAMAFINEMLAADIDNSWFSAAVSAYEQLEQALTAFRLLNPPDEYKNGHSLLLESVAQYEQGIAIAYTHLEARDLQQLSEINSYFSEGFRLNALAFNELAEQRDAYYDNMEMMSEAIKKLDEAAGIDRNSVRTNISADGQELIGEWGLTDDQGVYHVFISLQQDGVYYGYKRGEYPELTNGMSGTWSYDASTLTIQFVNEKIMENGIVTDAPRTEMNMAVMYFKDGELRMHDTKTLNSFVYFKAD